MSFLLRTLSLAFTLIVSVRGQQYDVSKSVAGTACPPGTTLIVTRNGDSLTVPYPPFSVRRGDNVPQSEGTGNCEFAIVINGTTARRFTVSSASYHDDLDLGANETATHYMTYFFQAHPAATMNSASEPYIGPMRGSIDGNDAPTPQVYGACGAASTLFVNSRGAVVKSNYSTEDTSSRRSKFNTENTVIQLAWEDC